MKREVNLRFNADALRCKLSHEDAYEVAALCTHWTPLWQSVLTPDAWGKAVIRFKRGGLDTELVEKCNSKVLRVATDFRYLQTMGCKLAKAVAVDTQAWEFRQAEATKARESAMLADLIDGGRRAEQVE